MIKIVIYDDNKTRQESLDTLLSSIDGFKVVGVFPNCSNVENEMILHQPDVVLMDIGMPVVNGLEGVQRIRAIDKDVKIIMQTVFEDEDKIFEALKYGASGYILKKTEPAKIIDAINDVMEGGAPMTPAIASKVISFFAENRNQTSREDFGLTDKEANILHYLVEGKSYKMIAEKINISYHTVNSHIKKIYTKLHVHSVAEAVNKAINDKIV
jgi:DNA-binding NarL/FixJ family response regulator